MCKRYKVRPQIDIPVGIFQLSRVIELEIDIDRLRSPSAPCAAYRPCPPLTAFAPRHYRSLALATLALRSPSAPCASATPPCPPRACARSASPAAPWHGLRPKVWGLRPNSPPTFSPIPGAGVAFGSPGDLSHSVATRPIRQ